MHSNRLEGSAQQCFPNSKQQASGGPSSRAAACGGAYQTSHAAPPLHAQAALQSLRRQLWSDIPHDERGLTECKNPMGPPGTVWKYGGSMGERRQCRGARRAASLLELAPAAAALYTPPGLAPASPAALKRLLAL